MIPLILLLAGSCADAKGAEEIVVSAAASLTDVFAEIETSFETANPEVDVTLNLAGSSALREQILEGAPVDVFASADRSNMDEVEEAGRLVGEARLFASNLLQIAVPSGNPAMIEGLADFARDDLLIGLCAVEVPCGALARMALARAGVTPIVDTNEPDVRALLTRIEVGELDAGITYVTDVTSSHGAVDGVAIPEDVNVPAEYMIGVVEQGGNTEGADRFVGFVVSEQGRSILARYGFTPP